MSGLTSLHKILKDETRQKIITLLAAEGSLSYTELLEQLDVLTGILNYHLKVLGDLLEKNASGHYLLSEKGQVAYRVLTEFPSGQPKVVDKRIYKAWIILTVASVILLILNGYFLNIPIERTALALAILLLATAVASTLEYDLPLQATEYSLLPWVQDALGSCYGLLCP